MRKHQLYYEAEAQGRIRSQPIYFADSATNELEELGRRLDQVRWVLRCATSDWAKTYWQQIEAHLLRRIRTVNLELEAR